MGAAIRRHFFGLPATSPPVLCYACAQSEAGKEEAMKEFHCGSLVPGCEWHTRAEEEAEVMRRAVEHMRETHGETIIRESMIDAIRSRIEKVRDAA
jgi:predicted small metal-binding protein